jgi:hypothetical protein
MNETEALARMVPPRQPRHGKWFGGILQIHLTRACDKSCYSCTQGSNLGGKLTMISVENFEKACMSLRDYFGVVGIFGGNPALHPKFVELCAIMRNYIPFERRGLWCNHPKGKGQAMRETFNPAVSNLNVHLDREAYDEFKRDWPESRPFGHNEDSRHSPCYVAMKDVIADESERWSLIANCDINQQWSALAGEFRGQLRGWFCEIAAAQSFLHQWEPDYPDTGVEVYPGWWRLGMEHFIEQVRKHCHECSVPLRGYGQLAITSPPGTVEQVSETHESIYHPKRSERLVELVTDRLQLREFATQRMTDYMGNAKRLPI